MISVYIFFTNPPVGRGGRNLPLVEGACGDTINFIYLFIYVLTRPDIVIFVDEVSGDTSQEGDGAVGGQKKIVPRGTAPKESAATNINHFTMLGFTAATGEPVMCALIMKGKTIKAHVIACIDILADVNGKESDGDFIQKIQGKGNTFQWD